MRPTAGLTRLQQQRLSSFAIAAAVVLFLPASLRAESSATHNAAAPTADTSQDYQLAPGDRLSVLVLDQPQLSGDFIVNGSGRVLLPLAGSVSVSGLTLEDAQSKIQETYSDGILSQPAVSVNIKEYRPIFVTGDVKKPGSYTFVFGESAEAAIATAGGVGSANQQSDLAAADFISADERYRQLAADQLLLTVRKARLEAQRNGQKEFAQPQLASYAASAPPVTPVYTAEHDTFVVLVSTYQNQIETLERQRPRMEAEFRAVTEEINAEQRRLELVNQRTAEVEQFAAKGLARKPDVTNQYIDQSLIQAELSRLRAEAARMQQNMGDLDFKIEETKASYKRQVMSDLQDTLQRLTEIESGIEAARRLRNLKAAQVGSANNEPSYTIWISRTRQSSTTFTAAKQTVLQPGDVVTVRITSSEPVTKMERPNSGVESLEPPISSAQPVQTKTRIQEPSPVLISPQPTRRRTESLLQSDTSRVLMGAN